MSTSKATLYCTLKDTKWHVDARPLPVASIQADAMRVHAQHLGFLEDLNVILLAGKKAEAATMVRKMPSAQTTNSGSRSELGLMRSMHRAVRHQTQSRTCEAAAIYLRTYVAHSPAIPLPMIAIRGLLCTPVPEDIAPDASAQQMRIKFPRRDFTSSRPCKTVAEYLSDLTEWSARSRPAVVPSDTS